MTVRYQSNPDDIVFNFRDIEGRLRALEGVSPSQEVTQADIADLRALIKSLTRWRSFDKLVNEVFRSGAAHAVGLIPDPGDAVDDEMVLTEQGWHYPIRGLLRAATTIGLLGSTQFPGDIMTAVASLALTGNIGANKGYLKDLEVAGVLRGWSGVLDPAAGEAVANSGSTETTYVLKQFAKGDFLAVGGTGFQIEGRTSLAANGNTKTLKAYIGGTSITVYSAAGSGINLQWRVKGYYRGVTGDWVLESFYGTDAGPGGTVIGTVAQDPTLAFDVKITMTGTASSDLASIGSTWRVNR